MLFSSLIIKALSIRQSCHRQTLQEPTHHPCARRHWWALQETVGFGLPTRDPTCHTLRIPTRRTYHPVYVSSVRSATSASIQQRRHCSLLIFNFFIWAKPWERIRPQRYSKQRKWYWPTEFLGPEKLAFRLFGWTGVWRTLMISSNFLHNIFKCLAGVAKFKTAAVALIVEI